MTRITLYKDVNGSIFKYTVEGHAGYSTSGNDIVCAAISMLVQTTLIALNEVSKIDENNIDYNIDEKKGILEVSIPRNLPEKQIYDANIILKTMEVGIKALIESYPKYITLRYGEV
ncbi:ribosomal-processing cysteine protease Prp [Anaerosalibacter sp. Marseille-P3206]|uniref:ribosomal-processing cysteine protease Prp n=1 Tax=Anaerosalibacter sp. Marseille-P3206 TaxID=1871005 RepID=UPI000985DB71|nr:ribosomal-processing cysteine protease Prp [Anaerosalibacter sp. Marseille-P3206]